MSTINHADAQAEAIAEMREAVATYGMPVWYVKISINKQWLVPLDVRRNLLAEARPSEGWVNDKGCWYRGRLDAQAVLRNWASSNVYKVMTVREIADSASVPQTAVRKLIAERPDILRKSDGRTYEVRDPQADRAAQKGR